MSNKKNTKKGKCIFCNDEFTFASPRQKIKGKKGLMHHLNYQDEITVECCVSCHQRLHGIAAVHNHAFKKRYAKDEEVYEWAKRVVQVYYEVWEEPKLIAQALTAVVYGTSGKDTEH